ncbi:MAG: hypothetical protein LBS62_03195 [Clostridiales bacterium]|jgi:N-acetylglucosamine kinase-like BadF-type ATPase|nr:hypothetical protein [Clostridiales bacterium]
MQYVIGVDGGLTHCVIKAKDMDGHTLAEKKGGTTNHSIVGIKRAGRMVAELTSDLLREFNGKRADCKCVVVSATGIDSPRDRLIVEEFYAALQLPCPIFCINDGVVALYEATGGVGMLAISDAGSIVVGRNKEGVTTRSGGYGLTIMSDEGSGRWLSIMALNHMSKWVDGSVPTTPLVENMISYFHGFDSNKLIQCSNNLRRHQIKPEIALMVYQAAEAGDEAAAAILRKGAWELFEVARTVVRKLGFDHEQCFLSGMWGSVFQNSALFADKYKSLFSSEYGNSKLISLDGDGADSAARMALDYLNGKVPFIAELYNNS